MFGPLLQTTHFTQQTVPRMDRMSIRQVLTRFYAASSLDCVGIGCHDATTHTPISFGLDQALSPKAH